MNDLKIILAISIVLISPIFINEAFAFTEVNNTFGFTLSPSSGHGAIGNNGDLTCPVFSPAPDYFYLTGMEIRIPDGTLASICERSFAEFDVSSISNFTNIVNSIELRIDIITDNLDTRVCDFHSMEVQASLISGVITTITDAFRVSVHNDIADGTTFLTGVGNPICDDPIIQNDQIIDLGSSAVTDMNDAFDVNQSFWGVGIKFTDETRPALVNCPAGGFNACNIRLVFDNPEIRINYTSITDTDPPIITISGNNPETVLKDSFYGDAGATATDDFSVDSADIVIDSSAVDTSVLGTFQVTFNVNDRVGNSATEAVRTVNVVEQGATITGGGGVGQTSPSTAGGVTSSVPSLSDIPPLVPSEPIEPPTRTLDEIFDLFSLLFEEVEPIPTLEVVPESVTQIPAPLSQPTVQPTEPSFIESIQNFFAGLFG